MQANYKLDRRDVGALISALAEIHEYRTIEISEWPELRYALANLVGDLSDQHHDDVESKGNKRVDLDHLMAEKFEEWERTRATSGAFMKSAVELLDFHLVNSGRSAEFFSTAQSPLGSVTQFKYAIDNERAWNTLEVQLCAMSREQLLETTFADLAHWATLAS